MEFSQHFVVYFSNITNKYLSTPNHQNQQQILTPTTVGNRNHGNHCLPTNETISSGLLLRNPLDTLIRLNFFEAVQAQGMPENQFYPAAFPVPSDRKIKKVNEQKINT